MLNINLFGGPGTGKSTTASEVFALLKRGGKKAELLQEYAKDLTYSEERVRLADQVHLLGEQHHRLFRLQSLVDFTVHDSPFVMGLTYLGEGMPKFPAKEFVDFTVKLHKSYNNLNVFLKRDPEFHPYQQYGRTQTLHEAENKDKEIREFLDKHHIPYVEVSVSESAASGIVRLALLKSSVL